MRPKKAYNCLPNAQSEFVILKSKIKITYSKKQIHKNYLETQHIPSCAT